MRAMRAGGALLVFGLISIGSAARAGCYDPSWDVAHATRVAVAPGVSLPMEVRGARDNTTDASLLLVKGAATDYLCVPIGPRVRRVQYPFQGPVRIDSVTLGARVVVAINGAYNGGADCCQLLQFLRIDPKSGAVGFNTNGGFVLPRMAQYRYGVARNGQLEVLTATRVQTVDAPSDGPHNFRLARFEYDPTAQAFTKLAEWSAARRYDLGKSGVDVFAGEGMSLASDGPRHARP